MTMTTTTMMMTSATMTGSMTMTDELVERLRNPTYYTHPTTEDGRLAADRIEKLIAERYRLRDALEYILAECTLSDNTMPSVGAIKYAARAALKGESHE